MAQESFNLRALERSVFRSVDELVDDCYSLRHRESLELLLKVAFDTKIDMGLNAVRIELVHQNYLRITGIYPITLKKGNHTRVLEANVVIEGLYDFSPRNWAFRFDVLHMRAEAVGESPDCGEMAVGEVLARWRRLPALGTFRYRRGVFFFALHSLKMDPTQQASPA